MTWDKERIRAISSSKRFAVVAASALSLASGASIGHILTKRVLSKKFDELMEKELDQAKAFYAKQSKEGEFSDPEELAKKYQENDLEDRLLAPDVEDIPEEARRDLTDAIRTLKYHADSPETVVQKPSEKAEVRESIRKNIFENAAPIDEEEDEDEFEREKSARDNTRPYIISHDEYFNNDTDYNQNTITYFEEDDVLVDEEDTPIRNEVQVVGEGNLLFGRWSKDENIVYIRNEKLEVDFEVVRSHGSYAKEILGFIQHDDQPRQRKFRHED